MRVLNRFSVWFLFIFVTNGLYAQEFSERSKLIGTELLSLVFGGYLGHYSSIFNDGKYEVEQGGNVTSIYPFIIKTPVGVCY